MKRMLLVLSLITVICSFASAQSVDPRLQSVFSEDYLQDISTNHPNELRYLNWYLDNSFTIIEVLPEKTEGLLVLKFIDIETKAICGTVESFDIENINIFQYSFERKYDRTTTYLIGSTGYAIVFDSEKKLAENYNLYQYGK